MAAFLIGDIAKRAGVNVETVRYYERRGLLQTPQREASGYRKYGAEDLQRIRFIKRAQELGFSLNEILELLSIRSDASCHDIKTHVQAKLGEIDSKIRTLQKMKRILKELDECCPGSESNGDCPILEALDQRCDDDES